MTASVRGACPLDCPDTCGWVVTVRDGRAVDLRGDRDHPFTRGALCVKVNKYLEHTTASDRLLYPLRRAGRKGVGRPRVVASALRRARRGLHPHRRPRLRIRPYLTFRDPDGIQLEMFYRVNHP